MNEKMEPEELKWTKMKMKKNEKEKKGQTTVKLYFFLFIIFFYVLFVAIFNIRLGSVTQEENEGDVILVLIPGHGTSRRFEMMKNSILHLQKTIEQNGDTFDCQIYGYDATYKLKENIPNCKYSIKPGYHWIQFTEFHKIENEGKYAYIILLLDDIRIQTFNWNYVKKIMQINELDAAAPRCSKSPYDEMKGTGRYSKYINTPGCQTRFFEIHMNIFSPKAFQCFQSMIDTKINYLGWGYDLVYDILCPEIKKVMIYGNGTQVHHTQIGGSTMSGQWTQMNAYFDKYESKYQFREKMKNRKNFVKVLKEEFK